MSQTVFGAQAVVTMLNRAFNNGSPGNAVFNNQVATAGTTEASWAAFANQFGNNFAGLTNAEMSTRVLGNLGVLPNAELEAAVTQYFADNGLANRGLVVLQLAQILSTLETAPAPQNIFNAAAIAWNKEVERGFLYSSDVDNTVAQQGDFTTSASTLTRETDVLTGPLFNGYLDYNKFTGNDEQTLTNSDRLTGTAADNDVLFAQLLNAANTRPRLDGIEIISAELKGATGTLDLTDTKGAKQVVNQGSAETAALTFNNIGNIVDVVVRNTTSDTTAAWLPSVMAGSSDAVNLVLEGAGTKIDRSAVTLTPGAGTAIETINVKAATTASVLSTVTSAGVKTVNVTADVALTIGDKTNGSGFTSTEVATLDASAATAGVFLNVSAAGGKDQTITLGAGNDTVVVSGLTAKDTITGGNGVDRMVLATGDTGTNEATKMVGVEQIEVRAAGSNLNLIAATDVNLIAVAEVAGTASINNVTAVKSGLTFAFEGEGAAAAVNGANAVFGDVKYNLANATGTTDVINFAFNNGGVAMAANSTVTIGTLTNSGNNVETLNFNFADLGATNTVTVADINVGTALKALNVTSDSKVTLNNVNDLLKLTSVDATGVKAGFTAVFGALGDAANASVKVGGAGKNAVTVDKAENLTNAATTNLTLTLDGSAGTGDQTFTVKNNDINQTLNNTSAGVVVIGGTGGDTISVNTIVDARSSIQGGAGTDNITLSGAGVDVLVLSLGDTGSTVATGDQVTGFVATGQDLIDLRNFGFDVSLQGVTAAAGLLNGTANEFGGKAAAVANNGGNAVVYIDTNSDNKLGAGDLVLTLVGVAIADVGTADIIWS
ncbi:hypothetical protein [Acidovorax sp. ST3]|uniref:beta strand repeat-containing protein n=1 Tax=Acidovorax sp. ST3 TaxID=2219062 RepID=UPI000DA683CA|nr:hypothetical protein [Acidovorax sp. ST3]